MGYPLQLLCLLARSKAPLAWTPIKPAHAQGGESEGTQWALS